MDSTLLLKQAHSAIQSGDKGHARQLLQEAIRQNPQDYRTWLWLASITLSAQASLEYIKRAEMLEPHNSHVSKARAWAENRVRMEALEQVGKKEERRERRGDTAVSPTSTTTPRNWTKVAIQASAALFILILLAASGFFAWSYWANPRPMTTTTTMGGQPAELIAEVMATPEAALSTMTPTATAVLIPAKNIVAASDNPRPTWTLTPTPTNTPIPTNTPPPTFVSESGGSELRGRPLGVAADERWIDVDLSTQTLVAYEGNEQIFDTLISSGTYEHPTVTGQFRIWLKYEAQTMNGALLGYDYYLENVPYVMYFYNDYALHGTFWHNNFGTPMSHGCVNMNTSDAQWVFSWAGVGTVVNVHY